MRRLLPRMMLAMVFGASVVVIGCGDDSGKPAARTAENALGINPKGQKQTTEVTRDVTVIDETKVIDNKTGATISDTKKVTPVRITEETDVKKDVEVKVGETQATGTGTTPAPKPASAPARGK